MKTSIKRIAALLLALVVMIPVGVIGVFAEDAAASTDPILPTTGWGPNKDTGIFEITSAADFLAFASETGRKANGNYKGKTIILTTDIDLNPGWDASTKTLPTTVMGGGAFFMDGTFDGQGHTIKGICVSANENATLFTLSQNGSSVKNLKIENSYFHAVKNAAGIFSAARGPQTLTFENVYVNSIVECDNGNAAGFVSFFNATTSASIIPSVTMTNCVFAGSVTAGKCAAAFVGTNDKPSGNKGGGMYNVTMTDCANYGTITSKTENMAAGLIGNCANEAVLTRCYNAGTVATAWVNVHPSTEENNDKNPVTITIEDCYYLGTASTAATTKAAPATTITMKYDGAVATEAKTATVAELVDKTAFKASGENKGWKLTKDSKMVLPMMALEILEGHQYGEPVVTAPTCSAEGYSTYTCVNCGYSYVGDTVPVADHTEGDWIVDREATEELAGSRHTECTVCGALIKQEVIKKLEAATTEPVTDQVTEPATGETDTTAAGGDEEGGCGSSIALSSALGMASIIGLGAIVLGKKRR